METLIQIVERQKREIVDLRAQLDAFKSETNADINRLASFVLSFRDYQKNMDDYARASNEKIAEIFDQHFYNVWRRLAQLEQTVFPEQAQTLLEIERIVRFQNVPNKARDLDRRSGPLPDEKP